MMDAFSVNQLFPSVATCFIWLGLLGLTKSSSILADEPIGTAGKSRYFEIQVKDDQTGRPVPLVELQTTSSLRFYTDSAGRVALDEPELMGRKVFFAVASNGYEFKPDGFGIRGIVLEPTAGARAELKIHRLNIAERLYRNTGAGIYRDTQRLGLAAPVDQPYLNAEITGQDGVLTAEYQSKLYWFYGDTNRLAYALGNFAMSGATTQTPEQLDPSVGFRLNYFVDEKSGFAKGMARLKGEGVVWLTGLVVLPDESGHARMLAYYQRRRGLGAVLENGFMQYIDEAEQFDRIKTVPLNPVVSPSIYSVSWQDGQSKHLYFSVPYPTLRVEAKYSSYLDLDQYESYSCVKPRPAKLADDELPELERDANGKLVWSWKRNTAPFTPTLQQKLIAAGKMKREESPLRLQDVKAGKPVEINMSSCAWNAYRKRFIMIAAEHQGATPLGEVWYSEADRPEGPWTNATKVVTHANKPGDAHDFYNPRHHAFLDRDGGRTIYFEGSYANIFSGNSHPTPLYEYNQIMYRLDLSDPRLDLSKNPPPSSR